MTGSLGKHFRFACGSKVQNVVFFVIGAGSLSMIRVYGVQLVIGCNLELGSTGLSSNLGKIQIQLVQIRQSMLGLGDIKNEKKRTLDFIVTSYDIRFLQYMKVQVDYIKGLQLWDNKSCFWYLVSNLKFLVTVNNSNLHSTKFSFVWK